MSAICELVDLRLIDVAGEADAPEVVDGLKLVDTPERVDVMITELDESCDGSEVIDDIGKVDVVPFALDEPFRLVNVEKLSVEKALDEEDGDEEVNPPMTLNGPE